MIFRVGHTTKGRVFFTAGRELDRYIVWDFLARKKQTALSATLLYSCGPLDEAFGRRLDFRVGRRRA